MATKSPIMVALETKENDLEPVVQSLARKAANESKKTVQGGPSRSSRPTGRTVFYGTKIEVFTSAGAIGWTVFEDSRIPKNAKFVYLESRWYAAGDDLSAFARAFDGGLEVRTMYAQRGGGSNQVKCPAKGGKFEYQTDATTSGRSMHVIGYET